MKSRAALLLLFLFVFGAVRPVAAQQQPAIASLDIDIWPEYDQPSVLVIYHITVAPDQLPADLLVRIPVEAGAPSAVASVEANGMFNIPNVDVQPVGPWLEISFRATVPDVRVEYYDPTLSRDGDQREFVFRWGGGSAVQNLSLTVQQPPTAQNLTLEPTFTTSATGTDGLAYYSYNVGAVAADTQPFAVTLRYTKPDDALTNASQAVQPSQPIETASTGRVLMGQYLPWLLGGLGLLLILFGLLWYFRANRILAPAGGRRRHSAEPEEPPARAARRSQGKTPPAAPKDGSAARPTAKDAQVAAFCHKCGNKAGPGDVFCRVCGTRLEENG